MTKAPRELLRARDAQHDNCSHRDHRPGDGFVQKQSGKREPEEGVKQLQLADAGNPANRETAIPKNKADQHTEHRDVGEPRPYRQADLAPRSGQSRQRDDGYDRQREQQRPGDHLPSAEPTRQRRALGIAEATEQDRCDHQQIADEGCAAALRERETDDRQAAKGGEQPEGRLRPLSAAQHAENCRCERQQSDENDRMGRGYVLERQRRQQRKANHHAKRNDGQRGEIAQGGPLLPQRGKQRRPEQRGDDGAGGGQEQRRKAAHGNSGSRQRTAEDDYAEESAAPSVRRPLHRLVLSPRRTVTRARLALTATLPYNFEKVCGYRLPHTSTEAPRPSGKDRCRTGEPDVPVHFARVTLKTRLLRPNSMASGPISRNSTSEQLAVIAGVVFAVTWSARAA